MRRLFVIAVTALAWPAAARGSGFEIVEQSPQGVATAGAQTAVADDAAAVFYNPAGMAFQPGFGSLAGGTVAHTSSRVDASGESVEPQHTGVAPTLYATQRLGRHFAVGVGAFANFAEHFQYPSTWSGRLLATFVDITTATVRFAGAYRPVTWLAVGGGLDVVPAALDLYQGVDFGGGDGSAHAGLTAVGVGGDAGLLVDVVKTYLRFGFTYRSRVDLHFDGSSAVTAPPEVQSQIAGLFKATTALPLPHNFTFALSSRPAPPLLLSVDVHYTLWHDIGTLTLTQTSPTLATTSVSAVLDLRDTWGVRAGGELRFLDGRLRARLGGGWDQSSVPRATLGPLIPDTDRVVVSAGLGYHARRWSVDAAYLAAILLATTSENPDLVARYSTVGHLVSLALTLRFADFGGKLAANDTTWSGG